VERLAPGRVVLGVGTGWVPEEFAAARMPFDGRGARTDSAIRLIRHLHTVGQGPFLDEHYGFEVGYFAPKPTAPVPILVGGGSGAALRRAVSLGDGWHSLPASPQEFGARAASLRSRAARPFEVGCRISWTDLDDVVDQVRGFEAADADHLAVWFGQSNEYAERMAALTGALGRGSAAPT
jgi:Luciferase-like monooxygenase